MRRAAAVCLLLVAGVAWASPSADVRARVRALEELLDEVDYVGARAELDRLKQGRDDNESFDFFSGRVAFGEGRYADAVSALELAGDGAACRFRCSPAVSKRAATRSAGRRWRSRTPTPTAHRGSSARTCWTR